MSEQVRKVGALGPREKWSPDTVPMVDELRRLPPQKKLTWTWKKRGDKVRRTTTAAAFLDFLTADAGGVYSGELLRDLKAGLAKK